MKTAVKILIAIGTLILWVGVNNSYKSSLYETEGTPWEDACQELSKDIHSLRLHTDTTQYDPNDPYITFYKDRLGRCIEVYSRCETQGGQLYTPEKFYRINSKGDIVFNWAALVIYILWYGNIFAMPNIVFILILHFLHLERKKT